ncbi:hypothetical protein D3C85_1149140 [compost metagenome]
MEHFSPLLQALCNLIELFFYFGREIKINNSFKMCYQEIVYHLTNIGREEFRLFRSGNF